MQTKPYPVSTRSECFLPFGAGWVCPTPEEIRVPFDADSRANRKQSSHTDRTERQSNRQALDWGDTPIPFSAPGYPVEYAGLGKNLEGVKKF
ncbi:transcriptional regulator [Escherichia coli]|uniref:transcriptional regulator n=1 Tax=Escherichia coli TaxID=562 RepID=UPI00388E48CC